MPRLRYWTMIAIVVLTLKASAGPVGCGGSPSPGDGTSVTTTPGSLAFSGGGPQSLSLNPNGWIVDRFMVASSQPWLTASVPGQADATTGVCDGLGNCSSISVSVNATGLAPGSHSGAVLITPQYLDSCSGNSTFNQYVSESTVNVQVSFNVTAAAPVIQLSTSTLAFGMQAGAAPQTKPVSISNSGGGTLNWTAAVTSGASFVAISSSAGTAPGTLSVTAMPGSLPPAQYSGSVRISSTDSSVAPEDISVTMNLSAQPGAPAFSATDVLNAASLAPDAILSPGALVVLSGANLSAGASAATIRPLPTVLEQTKVLLSGIAAPLFYVSPTRIYFQMPYGLSGSQSLTVISNGVSSAVANVNIAPAQPGIFTLPYNGSGAAAVVNQDGTLNSASNPAARGSTISIYATGLGETNPTIATGQAGGTAAPWNQTLIAPQVTISGIFATVQLSCVAPRFVGLYQVNVTVPANAPVNAAVPVQIIANGNGSNVATIAIR